MVEHKRIFEFILQIFHFTGMVPVTIQESSVNNYPAHSNNKNFFLICWSLLHLILLLILIITVYTADGIFGNHNYIGEFNDMIKVASIYATHVLILIEALCCKHHLSAFWRKIREVDTNILSQFNQERIDNPEIFEKCFVKKFFLNLTVVLLLETIVISTIQEDVLWTNLWYLSIVSLTITRLRHLHLMLHVDTICFRLKVLRVELAKIVAKEQKAIKSFERLCLMKDAYNTLYECCSHVNFSFGFSQLFNLMQNFLQLTCDLYWIYSVLYRNDLTYILVLIVTLVPTFQVIIVVLSSCERCLKEVREIGFLLHNVDTENGDKRMDMLIENFSLQILHEPFNVCVSGFFNMDFTLLKAVSNYKRETKL